MRPETLEQCLAWLVDSPRSIAFQGSVLTVVDHWSEPKKMASKAIRDGDIPAAIVAATQQIWDQIHGEASE